MRQLLRFAIQRSGDCDVIEACNGIEGLKAIQQGGIDVALLDINMPLMDGFKMLQVIRQDARLAALPVVIITTEGKDESKERAASMGVRHYITKPINQGQVAKTIREILKSR